MTSLTATAGYVADIGYTAGFYPHTAPPNMAFAMLAAGVAPGRALRPKRILELGFGQGFGLALLAAANPDVMFEGCDFNPEHVAHAQGLIDEAALANLTVSGLSFAEAAHDGACDVDIVVANGVLSWIGRADRDAVVAILRRRLRPDGVLYVSYNSMPGWAPLAPIRALMLEVKRRNPGGTEHQLGLALDLIVKLWQGSAGYFVINPIAAHHVEAMLGMDRAYLAHEYLAEEAELPTYADIAGLLARAELSYVASADVLYNFDQYAVPDGVKSLVPQIQDPVLRELVRDFAANRRFRRDLFARTTPSGQPHRELLPKLSFALAVPPDRVISKFLGPVSELILKPEFHASVIALLAQKIASFDELLALPAFAGSVDLLLDGLALLVHSGQVLPMVTADGVDQAPAQRFNRVIVARARNGQRYGHVAAPVARTGVPVDEAGLMELAAALADEPGEHNQGSKAAQIPLWRRLGVL
jgi:SAM-dependent methyltransferase